MLLRTLFNLLFLGILIQSSNGQNQNHNLKWNHIQTVGSHNSYHLPEKNTVPSWNYSHRTLTEQLKDHKIRQLEIDVHSPSLNVYHIQDYDMQSSCSNLGECLHLVKDWSNTNANHVPLFIILELKNRMMTVEEYDALDESILSSLGRDKIFTPDDLRSHLLANSQNENELKSLKQIVKENGWPTIQSSRGKIIFLLLGDQPKYVLDAHQHLVGRTSFLSYKLSDENNENAIFFYDDLPIKNQDNIKRLVKEGFIVRTRADSDYIKDSSESGDLYKKENIESSYFNIIDQNTDKSVHKSEFSKFFAAISGSPLASNMLDMLFGACTTTDELNLSHFQCILKVLESRGITMPTIPTKEFVLNQRKAAFESGAQFISTDHYVDNDDYTVKIEGEGSYLCNPITSNDINCIPDQFEEIKLTSSTIPIPQPTPSKEEL